MMVVDHRGDAIHVGLVFAIGEYVRQMFGVEMSVIIWAFCGGFFGTGLAPKTGLMGSLISYMCSSMLSALIATGAEHAVMWTDVTYTHITAAAIAACFYPLLAEMTKHTSAVLKAVLTRLGLYVRDNGEGKS